MSSNEFQNMSFTAARFGYLAGGGGGGNEASFDTLDTTRLTGGIAASWPPAPANCKAASSLAGTADVTLRMTLFTENASCNSTKTPKWVTRSEKRIKFGLG